MYAASVAEPDRLGHRQTPATGSDPVSKVRHVGSPMVSSICQMKFGERHAKLLCQLHLTVTSQRVHQIRHPCWSLNSPEEGAEANITYRELPR